MKILKIEKLRSMAIDQLEELMIDVIDAREAYPENSINRKALALDDYYLDVDNTIHELEEASLKVREYVTSDIIKKEAFSDIEICCAEDMADADERIDDYLSRYSVNTCNALLSAMNNAEFYLIEGGWHVNGENHFN